MIPSRLWDIIISEGSRSAPGSSGIWLMRGILTRCLNHLNWLLQTQQHQRYCKTQQIVEFLDRKSSSHAEESHFCHLYLWSYFLVNGHNYVRIGTVSFQNWAPASPPQIGIVTLLPLTHSIWLFHDKIIMHLNSTTRGKNYPHKWSKHPTLFWDTMSYELWNQN